MVCNTKVTPQAVIEETKRFMSDEHLRRSCFDKVFTDKFEKKYKKKYPQLIKLLKAIYQYDLYFKKMESESNPKLIKSTLDGLKKKLDAIRTDDHFNLNKKQAKKEKKLMDKANFNMDVYNRRIYSNIDLIANCQEIVDRADSLLYKGDVFGAISKYMQVVTNDDVNAILLQYEQNSMNCSSFKSHAAEKVNESIDYRYSEYHKYYNLALKETICEEKHKLLLKAQEKINFLSIEVEKELEKDCIQRKIEANQDYLNKLSLIMNEIIAEFNAEFGTYDISGDLSNKYVNGSINKGNTISFVVKDSVELRNWFKEVNFRYGQYESIYEDDLLDRLQKVLNFAIENYDKYIENFTFSYIGSSDATGFKNKAAPLKLKYHKDINKSYSNVNINICESDRWDIRRKNLDCFGFKDLTRGTPVAEFYNLHGQERTTTDTIGSDYSKNLVLAYLRARYRHDKLMSLIKIPKSKYKVDIENLPNDKHYNCECECDCTIKVQVSQKRGYQYRSVNMKIGIKFFESLQIMELNN